MTEKEITRALRRKWPSLQPRAVRKSKLKMRYKGDRLMREIRRTREKLDLLLELRTAEEQVIINGE